MDNLTHTLTAIALSRAGGKRFTPHATAILVLAVNIPNVDISSGLGSPLLYLQCHRGITHSFSAAPLLAAAVLGLVVLARKLRRSSGSFPLLPAYLVALFGVLFGHLFLDWSTSYGTRLLLPFSARWLSWDAVPIIDLWLLGVLLAAALLPVFFGMITEEIGARRGNRGRGTAIFALVFLLGWFGLRGLMHARAVAVLDARLYSGLVPQRVGAFATVANPFRWHGVVQTSEGWKLADVNVLEEFDPDSARTFYRPEAGPALESARTTRTARVFLDFARFPYSYAEPAGDGYRVIFRDLRFHSAGSGGKAFVAEILENTQFQVTAQSFSFRPPRNVR